jgi:hypothetical protein
MRNESLRARPSCDHYLATVRRSVVDSAPPLSTAQAVDLSGWIVADVLPLEFCPSVIPDFRAFIRLRDTRAFLNHFFQSRKIRNCNGR